MRLFWQIPRENYFFSRSPIQVAIVNSSELSATYLIVSVVAHRLL
jgi:hypothetical protein